MQYRVLGKTGLKVSRVSFGAIRFMGLTQDVVTESLNLALDLGINFIDTARNYGDSEAKIGIALEHRRDDYYIATKIPASDADEFRRRMDICLKELRTDRIDLMQIHSLSSEEKWQQTMAPNGALKALRKAQDEGLIDHVGFSSHRSLDTMRKAITCGEFESIMLCYDINDSENVGPQILPLAAEHGIGVIIMKALGGGNLVSPGFENGARAGDEDPLVTKCLRYVLTNDAVDIVIPGMVNVGEVRQNVRIGSECKPMTDEEVDELRVELGKMNKTFRYGQFCLRCGYCLPCPQGIDIPEVFRIQAIQESYPDNVKYMAREAYERLEVKPDACVECRECVEKCPGGVNIPEKLKEAFRLMEKVV